MTAELRDSLAQVQELLGRATPGPWAYCGQNHGHVCTCGLVWGDGDNHAPAIAEFSLTDNEFEGYRPELEQRQANTALTVSAVNFLREHGPELMKRLDRHGAGDAEDSARLDWLCTGNRKRVEDTITTGWFRVYHDVAPMSADHAEWRAMTEEFYPTTREAIDAAMAGERGVSNADPA